MEIISKSFKFEVINLKVVSIVSKKRDTTKVDEIFPVTYRK